MKTLVDARQYAALRIAFGLWTLWCFLSLLPFSTEFFSNEGWLPPQIGVLTENTKTWSIFYAAAHPIYTWVLMIVAIVSALTMTIGFHSRLSSWLCLIFVASVSVRNHFVFSGEDCILRNFLYLIALSRSGDAWSLDSWIERKSGQSLAKIGPVMAPIWPLRLMQVQVCAVYFTSGLAKQRGTDWLGGLATIRAILNPAVGRFSNAFLNQFAPFFMSPFFHFSEQVTLYWELLFPFLMLQRHLRYGALAVGVMVHCGIFILFQVHFFSFAMVSCYLSLVPAEWITRFGHPLIIAAENYWERFVRIEKTERQGPQKETQVSDRKAA